MANEKKSPEEITAGLAQFTGTEQYHRISPIHSDLVVTDGVKYLCDAAGAYWLIDVIASWQRRARRDPALRDMQFWTLTVETRWTHEDFCPVKDADTPCCGKTLSRCGVVRCWRDEGDRAFSQRIPYTDFPLPEVKIWVQRGESAYVAMLPGEY